MPRSLRSRMAKLKAKHCPPGQCWKCGAKTGDDAPVMLTVVGCSDRSCSCNQPGADPYDPVLFEQSYVAPKCPECEQHKGCSMVECLAGKRRATGEAR